MSLSQRIRVGEVANILGCSKSTVCAKAISLSLIEWELGLASGFAQKLRRSSFRRKTLISKENQYEYKVRKSCAKILSSAQGISPSLG